MIPTAESSSGFRPFQRCQPSMVGTIRLLKSGSILREILFIVRTVGMIALSFSRLIRSWVCFPTSSISPREARHREIFVSIPPVPSCWPPIKTATTFMYSRSIGKPESLNPRGHRLVHLARSACALSRSLSLFFNNPDIPELERVAVAL